MVIDGKEFKKVDVYDVSVTVPDCFVCAENKTGRGNGEAKLYMGPKDRMRLFYANNTASSFQVKCILLKSDLIEYMNAIKHEYYQPSIEYRGSKKTSLKGLWKSRYEEIESLDDVLTFEIKDQEQIKGPRGYVNTSSPLKGAYGLLRRLSLPFISYISVMKLKNEDSDELLFYWKLFADFSQMAELQYSAKHYGDKKSKKSTFRDGQSKYRQGLLDVFQCCPFTHLDDVRLLIASHIKPWALCKAKEKNDCNNGLILSPLYDKLFDKGFITFTNEGNLLVSDWLSKNNIERIDFKQFQADLLHLTKERQLYLDYHRKFVFKK